MRRYSIQDTPNGYRVVDPRGNVVPKSESVKRGPAMTLCASLNSRLAADAAHAETFYANQSHEFIARTR